MADNPRIEDLRRRIQKDPASIAFAQLAEELRRAGQSQEAVEICTSGLASHPGYLSARVTLGRALLRSDKLGQQALSARAHYLLGTIARDAKENAEARDHFRWVITTLDTMKKDQGAENLLERADMKQMYEASTHWLKSPGS